MQGHSLIERQGMNSHNLNRLQPLLQREWLVTNGLGGYAMGAIDGSCQQTHHALFIMPVRPPLQRVMFIRQIDETVLSNGKWRSLSTDVTQNTDAMPDAKPHLQHDFALECGMPQFKFSIGKITIIKRLWMPQQDWRLFIRYEMIEGPPTRLRLVPGVSFRDLETGQLLAETYLVRSQPNGILVYADPNEKPCIISANRSGLLHPVNSWKSLQLYDPGTNSWQAEEVYLPSAFEFELRSGESVTMVFQIESTADIMHMDDGTIPDTVFQKEVDNQFKLAQEVSQIFSFPPMQHLAIGARQFLIQRASVMTQRSITVLAGYPAMSDLGREAMIALPGLLLTTRQFDLAKAVFSLYLKHIKHGLIPSHFSCRPQAPDYESLDATLWMFVAIYEYWRASRDKAYLEEVYSLLLEILHSYLRGSAQGIKVDAEDGLLFALDSHRPLTWMNAASGNWLATPRHGKAIEVQALWYNALQIMAEFAEILGKEEGYKRCSEYAERTAQSMAKKFWCDETANLYDCLIDNSLTNAGRTGNNTITVGDPAIRPNQIIAVGLPYNIFSHEQTRAIIDTAVNKLVTPYGLRTLSPDHPAYCGTYTGSSKRLASARHNGCVYPWLVLPFTRAYLRVYDNPRAIYEMFEALFNGSERPCSGHLAEMYDGDKPHHPRGVPAYAPSTGAVLQSWQILQGQMG